MEFEGGKQMAKDKAKKKLDVKFAVIVIFLLLTIATLVVAELYVWAKYVTSRSGAATAQVAEFNFQLKNINGDSTVTSQSGIVQFPITRTDGNSKVAANVLAPDTYGRFDMIIDTTGTQTSYEYDIDVTVTNCPTNLIFYLDSAHTQQITTVRAGDGTNGHPKVATFTISKYVPVNRADGQHKEIVYWAWPYETGTGNQIQANDLIDSADMNKTVTMNIVASATQVTGQPAGVPTVGTASESVDNIVSIELAQNGHRDVTINNGSQANVTLTYTNTPANLESISVVSSDSSVATGTVDTANNRIVINALKAGTATITLRGEESWDLIGTVGVTVKPIIGDTVNYSATLNGQTLNNWKVFYIEGDYTYIILGDYMPNAAIPAGTELATSGSYNVYSNNSRAELLSAMTTKSNWADLINTGKINGINLSSEVKSDTNVWAIGSPTLELWVNSWNTSYPSSMLYTATNTYGYYVGTAENPTGYYVDISNGNQLYFPHSSTWNNCNGYWLASYSANGAYRLMRAYYVGSLSGMSYDSIDWAFRPVIRLTSSLLE